MTVRSERSEQKDDRRPVPDPTALTTEQLHREVANIREVIEAAIAALTTLVEEKFKRVTQQFDLIEHQRIEQKTDTRSAVEAALTAQKESVVSQTEASERAISKSETATAKQLEDLRKAFSESMDSLRREIGSLKDRIVEVDAKVSGQQMQRAGAKEDRTGLYAVIGVVGTLAAIAAVVAAFLRR